MFLFFLLLRLFDEFKDAEDDAKYRPYRPVPRGLVSFKELNLLILISITVILAANALITPALIPIVLLILLYIGLMTKEFFVNQWLKAHPVTYMASHMVVMPLFDLYSTGLDWIILNAEASVKLILFLIISYLNGMVIEIGRKIRANDQEEHGVETYSALWGPQKAVAIWYSAVTGVFLLSLISMISLNYSMYELSLLGCIYLISGFVFYRFYRKPVSEFSKSVENMAGIWTLSMYLLIGGFSGIWRLIHLF